MLWKTTFREIKHTLGRYLAIFAIVMLGVGFYVGLKLTRPVMVATVQDFVDSRSLYDYRFLSALGFQEENVEALKSLPDVRTVCGSITLDVLYVEGENENVLRLHSITEGVNECSLVEGRMPEAADECVIDSRLVSEELPPLENIRIAGDNDKDTLDMLAFDSYKVVGIVQNPFYLNYERGTTSVGSGRLAGYAYIPEEGFDTDYYTEIFLKYDRDFEIYSEDYENFIEEHEAFVETALKDQVDTRYASVLEEAQEELADGEQKLAEAEQDWSDGEKELAKAEEELAEGRKELSDGKTELADGKDEIKKARNKLADGKKKLKAEAAKAEEELKNAKKKLDAAGKEISENEKQLVKGEKAAAEAEARLDAGEAELNKQKQELINKQAEIQGALAAIAKQKAELGEQLIYYEAELNKKEAELSAALLEVQNGLEQVEAGLLELASARKELERQKKELAAVGKELAKAKQELAAAKKTYEENLASYKEKMAEEQKKLSDAEKELSNAEAEIKKGEKRIAESEAELAGGEAEVVKAKQELEDGKKELEAADAELSDAKQKIADIPAPDYYMLGRGDNIGFACFESDSMIVDNIADVFPVFFFLVALLVCITTMNRMVDDQRTQIGVLKALGYSRLSVMGEYIFYSGSSAFSGGLLGYAMGSIVFPYIIWNAYGIMYEVSGFHLVFDWRFLLFSILVSLFCSVGATVFSCYVEFASVPATLMRPKAPRSGRRIFLEYITPFWSRLTFLKKVSVRNVFRYKKRFLMMVLGISGCSALVLTGYGMKDSIVNIAENQYDKIQTYDLEISLDKAPGQEEMGLFKDSFSDVSGAQLFLCQETVDVLNGSALKQANLVTPEDENAMGEFWHLFTEEGEEISYPGKGEAVLNAKLAEKLKLEPGDTFTVRDSDMHTFTVTLTALAQNYVYNYIFVSRDTYRQGAGREPEYKKLCVKSAGTISLHELAAMYTDEKNVLQAVVLEDTRERLNNMMDSLDAVVLLVIICAGILCFIVLYNLTNINITERIREIATIKVLGFYSGETAQYVFRENMLLTAIGTAIGLLFGIWLHHFVIQSIDIDLISFDIHIKAMSYVMSVVMTFIFALLVDVVMYGRLGKINMAESLKSIE